MTREIRVYYDDDFLRNNSSFMETFRVINKNDIIYNNVNTVLVAVEDGKILGTVTLIIVEKLTGRLGLIEDVAVAESHRHLNIGTELVKIALELARAENCYKVILTTPDDVVPFYEQLGMSRYQNCMVYKFDI